MFNVSNHWGDDDEEDKYDYFKPKANGDADNHKKAKKKKKKDKLVAQSGIKMCNAHEHGYDVIN